MTAEQIPASFRALLTGRPSEGGVSGDDFLRQLPPLLDALLADWELHPDGPARHGECALVLPVTGRRGSAALKVTWPHPEARHEHLALKAWGGRGAVRMIAADPARWALLLERALPERDLQHVPIEAACTQLGALLTRLARPGLPQLDRLSTMLGRLADQLAAEEPAAFAQLMPRRFVDRAIGLCRELAAEPHTHLLHADLHYENVLRSADDSQWLAIDPKPLAGRREFEVAPALWNRWDEVTAAANTREHLRMRVFWLCEAGGLDEDLARAYSLVREAQNARWAALDGAGARDRITMAVTIMKAMS